MTSKPIAKPLDYSSIKLKELEELPNDEYVLSLVAQLEKQCQKHRVDPFYSCYVMAHLKYLTKEKAELLLLREIDTVSRAKSVYHKITELVVNRERFLSMLRQQVEDYANESVRDHVKRLAGEST